MKKAIFILSGGLDSAVNLAWAATKFEVVRTVTFDYGQRAARAEIAASIALSQYYHLTHSAISLPMLKSWSKSSVNIRSRALPKLQLNELDNRHKTMKSAKAVWVPNRNGVFINVAAALA